MAKWQSCDQQSGNLFLLLTDSEISTGWLALPAFQVPTYPEREWCDVKRKAWLTTGSVTGWCQTKIHNSHCCYNVVWKVASGPSPVPTDCGTLASSSLLIGHSVENTFLQSLDPCTWQQKLKVDYRMETKQSVCALVFHITSNSLGLPSLLTAVFAFCSCQEGTVLDAVPAWLQLPHKVHSQSTMSGHIAL